MDISVLSGKGGTGKTFISCNLFELVDNSVYIDCDVEEPNGHIYFDEEVSKEEIVHKLVPEYHGENCSLCRDCVDFCKFNALSLVRDRILVFDDMCHSCGGCSFFCKESALKEVERPVGKIEERLYGGKSVYTGSLNIGEASGVEIINRLLDKAKDRPTRFIDCPPGTDCSVMESIRSSHYSIVVAEDTIFGLHNLKMVVELLRIFQKKFGLVINKSFGAKGPLRDYIEEEGLDLLLELPFDRELARINSDARLIVKENEDYRLIFQKLYQDIVGRVEDERITSSKW